MSCGNPPQPVIVKPPSDDRMINHVPPRYTATSALPSPSYSLGTGTSANSPPQPVAITPPSEERKIYQIPSRYTAMTTFPSPSLVLWPGRQSSQSRHCQSSIRRAKDKPGTVAVDCNITATITIKINRNWLTKDYKNLAQAERQGIKQTIRPHRQVRDATKWHAESNT